MFYLHSGFLLRYSIDFICTFAARRLTASSLRRCISGVPGQLLVLSVLVALEGGVGCGGWLRGSSVLGPPPP